MEEVKEQEKGTKEIKREKKETEEENGKEKCAARWWERWGTQSIGQ